MGDWKKSGVQIISVIISSGLIGTGFISFLANLYYRPNISIEPTQNEVIRIMNTGNNPATHVVVTVRSPQGMFTMPGIFSTENTTKPTRLDVKTIQFSVARLVDGNASFVHITLPQNTIKFVTIYVTYDQGSTKFISQHPQSLVDKSSLFYKLMDFHYLLSS